MSVRERAPSNAVAPGNLTPTSNGLGVERVGEIQRSRMLSAMVDVCAERGVSNVTVAQVVACSGVSRRTFYEQFSDCEDCFLAAVDHGIARVSEYVLPAYQGPGRWRERIRTSLIALLSFLDFDPGTGRLLIVDTLGAGLSSRERRQNVLAQIVGAVDEGRGEAKRGAAPLPLTAEGVVGGISSVLHSRLTEGSGAMLELAGPLTSMIVLPYLGPAAARRELARPMPPVSRCLANATTDPLREVHMRLTYRTVRVLMAVAGQPGGSNRQIADRSEITDQGQISKLLARLHGLGLIENTGAGAVRGAPNSWVLTSKGWEVQGALAPEAS